MVCPDEGEITAFAARTIPATAAARIEAHLADCDDCRNLVFALASGGDASGAGEHGPERIGRFEVLDVIGRGAMGVVYRARDPELDRVVAIKVRRTRVKLDDGEYRLKREAQALARLAHPNVVAVHETGQHDGAVYVAIEYVDGPTLDAWLRTSPPQQQVLAVLADAARGLAAAHAAGLVHRDFKPANVFVSGNRVAKVGDFGLARAERDAAASLADSEVMMTLSVSGSIVGTPAYMAPEQLRGEPATEASDQFSFCVTWFEALYGRRPFVGSTITGLLAAMARPLEIPTTPHVPRAVRRAIRAGLAMDPKLRLPSMTAVVNAFERRGDRIRRPLMMVAGLIAVVLAVRWQLAGAADPCGDGPREIAAVWNAPVRATLQVQFAGVSASYGRDTWERAAAFVDRYSTNWAISHRDACRATRVTAHQSEAVLDLRMACLYRRKQELAAAIAALRDPTPEVVQHAVELVHGVGALAQCEDVDALRAPVAPPADFVVATQVRALEARIASVEARTHAARLDGLEREATSITERATALGYPPLLADAWLARADLADVLGDSKSTEQALDQALLAAQAGRHRRAEIRAWSGLLFEVGSRQARYADGLRMLHHAEAVLAGYGDDPRLHATILYGAAMVYLDKGDYDAANAALDQARTALASVPEGSEDQLGDIETVAGAVAIERGRYDDSLSHFERVRVIRERALGANHPDVGKALVNIGNVYMRQADFARALETYTAAERIYRAALSAMHPSIGAVEGNIGSALMALGKVDDALRYHERSLANLVANRGPDHPRVGYELSNIGQALIKKRPREALSYLERARAVFVNKLGAEHVDVAGVDHNLAQAYKALGEDAQAEAKLRAAIAVFRKLNPDHPAAARSMAVLGVLLTRQKRYKEAAAQLESAIAILEKAHGADSAQVATRLANLGWTRNLMGRPQDAIAPLERAIAICEAKCSKELPGERFELAKALWSANRDRRRAVEVAELAKSGLDPATERDDTAEVEAWLASHRVPRHP